MCVCFVVFLLVFQYLAKRLAGKNVSEMTYFVNLQLNQHLTRFTTLSW